MITSSWVLSSLIVGALALPREHARTKAEAVQRIGRVQIPPRVREVVTNDGFDVLQHLSGNSPYFNSPGVGLDALLPHGCNVTGATYLIRHSDIYGNDFEYENTIAPFLYKLGNFTDRSSFGSDPSLAFLTNWTSPVDDPKEQIEKVTDLGKADAAALGALFAQRYHDILSVNGSQPFRFWTADASRDLDTSKAFISSFNGSFSNADLAVVDEGETQAANTLTPHESCDDFDTTLGSDEEDTFINTYAPAVAARLNGLAAPSFNWTASDVFAAQTLCGYDVVIRNYSSPFCSLFSESEWLSWEYANDLMYHRSLGYGNALAPTLGMPWVSASARLLAGTANATHTNSSAGHQSLFISFTHREEPPFIVTALGLFNTSNASMPADTLNYERAWRTSDILPFLANVGFERMQCAEPAAANNATGTYIRTLINNAPIPLPGCSSGPGASCALSNFTTFVAAREKQYGNFVSACALNGTNATSTLGIYEGVLPADGAAVQVMSFALNGSTSLLGANSTGSAAKKSGAPAAQAANAWGVLAILATGLAIML